MKVANQTPPTIKIVEYQAFIENCAVPTITLPIKHPDAHTAPIPIRTLPIAVRTMGPNRGFTTLNSPPNQAVMKAPIIIPSTNKDAHPRDLPAVKIQTNSQEVS